MKLKMKFFLMLTLVFMSTLIFAQAAAVDSTFVTTIGNFVTSLFGEKAGDTVMAVIFKVLGFLVSIDMIIMLVLAIIPTSSPIRSVFVTIALWLKKLVGDKKSGGGTFN